MKRIGFILFVSMLISIGTYADTEKDYTSDFLYQNQDTNKIPIQFKWLTNNTYVVVVCATYLPFLNLYEREYIEEPYKNISAANESEAVEIARNRFLSRDIGGYGNNSPNILTYCIFQSQSSSCPLKQLHLSTKIDPPFQR